MKDIGVKKDNWDVMLFYYCHKLTLTLTASILYEKCKFIYSSALISINSVNFYSYGNYSTEQNDVNFRTLSFVIKFACANRIINKHTQKLLYCRIKECIEYWIAFKNSWNTRPLSANRSFIKCDICKLEAITNNIDCFTT